MKTLRVDWVHDFSVKQHPGGAQQTNEVIIKNAPEHIEINKVSSNSFNLNSNCDIRILNNIRTFTREQILIMLGKPHINWFHDIINCPHQFPRIAEAKKNAVGNIFLSSLLMKEYIIRFDMPSGFVIPSAIDVNRFNDEGGKRKKDTALWLGDIQPSKGIDNVLFYAREKGIKVDFWGFGNSQVMRQINNSAYGTLKGFCPQEEVPKLMQEYKTFIHMPDEVEGFGRSVMEAYLSGCEIVINDKVGIKSFNIDDREEWRVMLAHIPDIFWETIEGLA